jgi:hypothetical protein
MEVRGWRVAFFFVRHGRISFKSLDSSVHVTTFSSFRSEQTEKAKRLPPVEALPVVEVTQHQGAAQSNNVDCKQRC